MRPRFALSLAFLSWLSFAEWKVLERLLFADPASNAFVVESVRGVLAGTPVSKSWQHRFLAPLLVSALGGADLDAVKRFAAITLLLANVLLFVLLVRRGAALASGLLAVLCLGFSHFVLAYKLEYPWDGVDQVLFVAFGAWAAQNGSLLRAWPLLVVGAFNHETIVYVPLWYLLGRDRNQRLAAIGCAIAIAAVLFAMRATFYKGQPDLPGQVFETPAPLVDNHVHVVHNLRAIFAHNWMYGRAHVSVAFLGATALFVRMALRDETRRAGLWSLGVLATIVCFGYVNETRHYLVLVAFWIAHAWPVPRSVTGSATAPSAR